MLKKYRKLKLILSVLLMILMATGLQKNEALANTTHSVKEIMDLTGILRDENGHYIVHGKYATRAEFARILVQASSYSGKTGSSNNLQLFRDVVKKSKYASYIQLAVKNSYMSGYINGNFKPHKAITVKEAAYGMLMLLGYTNDDFKDQMSNSRFDKFSELGLNKNINLSSKGKLTRSQCQTLFYNLINAKQKSGDYYGKTLGITFDANNKIDYSSLFVAKTKGPVITKKGWSDVLSRKLSSYTIIENNKVIASSQIKENCIAYYAEQANTIWIYNETICGTIENITYTQGDPQDITISGNTYVFENISDMKLLLKKNNIKKGSQAVLLLGRNDLVSKIVPIQSTLASGNWKDKLSFSLSKATIYYNNSKATSDAIDSEDVIYYAKGLKTVWAFHQRIFGCLGDITLNDNEPDAINVSEKSYYTEDSNKIKKRLQETAVQTKMPVVLLLGWDNKVYDLLSLSSLVADSNWQTKLDFSPSSGTIYKEGSIIATSDIHTNDVIYYSNELKTLWVYDNKAYGILKTITPNSSSPESILVAEKTYTFDLPPVNSSTSTSGADNLSENAWGKRLKENNIKAGDNVVVLFGFNGYVADILPVEKISVTITGYVLKTENQLVKNETGNSSIKQVVTIIDTEGTSREYPCSNSLIQAGMIVEVSFNNGLPSFKNVGTSSGLTIPSDITKKTFADHAHILAVKDQYYTEITCASLNSISWDAGKVLYYKYNAEGEITDLILNQVSDYFYQYGILKNIDFISNDDGTYSSTQFTFIFGDTESTLSVDNPLWSLTYGPKAVLIDNNQIKDMHGLDEVRISYISDMQANIGNNVCWIADDVSIFFYKNGKYYSGSLDDITDFSTATVKGYRDALGPIHIIIVTE